MKVLYEDNHIIAINKQASELVQGDSTGDRTLAEDIKDYIAEKYKKPGAVYIGLPHRLDRPVSGVVVFARTSKALGRMNTMFQEKEVKKIYYAIIKDRPPDEEGKLSNWLKKNEKQNKSYAYKKEVKGSKLATLSYRVIKRIDSYYLLEIDLHTGRHHQIRCQLAEAGCAIRGDMKYGYPRSMKGGGIGLHARQISFIHPVKKEPLTITAPLPDNDLWPIFKESLK